MDGHIPIYLLVLYVAFTILPKGVFFFKWFTLSSCFQFRVLANSNSRFSFSAPFSYVILFRFLLFFVFQISKNAENVQ